MSCRLNFIAEFDISAIEERLSTDDPTCSIESQLPPNNQDSASKPSVFKSIISLSPSGEIAVVAHKTSAVILTAKWNHRNADDDQPQEIYKVSSNIYINHENRGNVTAVLCLPLVFCGRDESSRPLQEDFTVDWSCVAVGFASGYVNFYDEAANLLFSKKLYNEPVVSLKCQSFQPADQTKFQDEYAEEVYIQYKSVVVRIPGSVVFQILREQRSHLAKVVANASNSSGRTPMSYKIWKMTKQESISDCEVVGPSSSSLFDHLRCASLLGGFHAQYQTAPPKTTQLVACGSNDFVGFHYYFESVSAVMDLKSIISTAVVGFFSSKDSSKHKKEVVTTDELVNRWFSIKDPNREGRCIIRSPNREYLAVTDNLGRVCVIDSARGTVVRVFKGYREAQCGWLTVEDENLGQQSSSRSRGSNRTLVYLLVIYSARTGRLEIWPAPVGTPVAVLDGGKNGRLLYTPHRFVGLRKDQKANWSVHKGRSCTLLNSEGKLFDIAVPFYCVLSEGEDRQYAHDSFLLKKLRHFLRETDGTDEEVAQEVGLTAAEMKSTYGMLDCVKLLSTSRNSCPEAVEAAVSVFIDKISLNPEKQLALSPSEKSLLTKSLQLRNLTSLYKYVRKEEDNPPDYFSVVEGSSKEPDVLSSKLFASRRDISNLRMRLAMKLKRSTDVVKHEAVVTFKEKYAKSTFMKFLSCFDIGRESKEEDDGKERVHLSLNLSSGQPPSEKIQFLSDLIFRGVLYTGSDLSKFSDEVLTSGISPIDLTLLAIHFWLDSDLSNAPDKDMVRFAQIIGVISHMEAESKIASDYNEISPWWNKVRDVLMASTSPINALTAAFACRSVAIRIECQIDAQYIKSAKLADDTWSDSDSSDCESSEKKKEKVSAGEWEAMSADRAQWNLLIALLEDVSILDCILSRNPRSETKNMIGKPLPILPYTKPVISLSNILREGTGSISKLVARWLASSGIIAKSVVDSTDVEWQSLKERSESKRKKYDIPTTFLEELQAADVVLEGKEAFASQGLRILKWHFPFSLTGSVLLMELSFCYFYEWAAMFTKVEPTESQDIFDGGMSCLLHLPSPHIKKGVCVLIWNSFLWFRMNDCRSFIDSQTPAPVRMRPSGFDSRPGYSDWLCFSGQFLAFIRLFLEVSEICDLGNDVEVDSAFHQHEDLWESNIAVDISPSSTLYSALVRQYWENLPLSLILQMASVMQIMIELNIQLTHCMRTLFGGNLFHRVADEFTENMNPASFEIRNRDSLLKPRYNFLISVVKAAYKSVSSLPIERDWSAITKEGMESALRWMGRCEEMVIFWHLDYDELRRYQVCLLYCIGFDNSAQEILPAVREKEKLAPSLLNIAHRRYHLFLEHSPHISENISSTEPGLRLSSSMLELDFQEVRQVDLEKTSHLLRYVLGISPSSKGTKLLHTIESIMSAL